MCHSADSLPSVLIKSSRVKSVSWSLSPYTNTPAIWKQVTGGVTVIEEGLWTLINPSVCCYHCAKTRWREALLGQSLALNTRQLGAFLFFLAEVSPWRQVAVTACTCRVALGRHGDVKRTSLQPLTPDPNIARESKTGVAENDFTSDEEFEVGSGKMKEK